MAYVKMMKHACELGLLPLALVAIAMLLHGCDSDPVDEATGTSNSSTQQAFLGTTFSTTTLRLASSAGPDSETTAGSVSVSQAPGSIQWPQGIMQCPTTEVETTPSLTCTQYDAMVSTIRNMYNQLGTACTATDCPQADWAGCVLRVAGHDLMDYANGQGGSDGCLDLHDADNAGLPECLHSGHHGFSIYDAYKTHCSEISLADFIVLAAEAVIAFSREYATGGNSDIDLRSNFRYGRTTAATCEFAEGRLPNPEESCGAVEETFVNRMGLSWRQAAALMGVHSLGRARPENSGYDGWWSDAVNSRKFNNNYYASIVGKGWMPEQLSQNKNQWKRSDAGKDRGATQGKEMMLNTDMCLAYTADRRGREELNAATTNCCAWTDEDNVEDAVRLHLDGEFCGSTNIPNGGGDQRELCCDGERDNDIDCGDFRDPEGPAINAVFDFARNEQAWLDEFVSTWKIVTENGFNNLQPLSGC